jgi:acetyl esterase/lipase
VRALADDPVPLRSAAYETMAVLADALLKLQVRTTGDSSRGAIACPGCGIYHTRAAEAVFPLAIAYRQTLDPKYVDGARDLAEWLFRQQRPEGEWAETPWAWTGTTADQLLMLAEAYPILEGKLSPSERERWKGSMTRAANYLVRMMDPAFASINYCPTTAAALMVTNRSIPDPAYIAKARRLAHQVLAKMDEAGFIQGEAARAHGVKYGVDLGYEMDMSLWGLGLYARLSGDSVVNSAVRRSLAKNLPFLYPNGALDGSWGSRCYKWAAYGSKTADGCQILFALYAEEDPRYLTAALRNLEYLRGMISGGMVGNGPDHWRIYPGATCVYPTFARAKNLALTLAYGPTRPLPGRGLPSDSHGWFRAYPTVDVVVARSKNFMMTVSAYGYRDPSRTNDGQYNQHPTGGSVCNLWVEGGGFLTTSSQTRYVRGESIHMPVDDSALCLTPRIEYRDSLGYFTNLYEFEGRLTVRAAAESIAIVSTSGEMKDEGWLPGGIGFNITNILLDEALEKNITLSFHDRRPVVRIVEPIVRGEGTRIDRVGARRVFVRTGKRTFVIDLLEGGAEFLPDSSRSTYRFPFPAMIAEPLVILVPPPGVGSVQKIRYRISVAGTRFLDVPRDEYFTTGSALERARRDFPHASPANTRTPRGLVAERGLVYARREGRPLHLDLFRPASVGERKIPAVLLIHGGGWRSGDRSMEVPMAQRLASEGYVTAAVEYRLSPEARFPAALCDAREALRWLRSRAGKYGIDTARMAVMGGSSGGHLAAFLGTNVEGEECADAGPAVRVRAVVDFDGPVDLTDPVESGKDGDPAAPSSAKQWLGHAYADRPDLWRKASPAFLVNSRTAPILFVNSAQPRYRAGRDTMIARMKELGIDNEVREIPDSPHTFWILRPWNEQGFTYALSFLNRQMKQGRQ